MRMGFCCEQASHVPGSRLLLLGALLLLLVAPFPARGQQAPQSPASSESGANQQIAIAPSPPTVPPAPAPHRFWDRTNDFWFAMVGASRAFDYASTLNLRARGDNEIFLNNAIVDNHPLFAGIEAAATGASIGVSYIFHRTGHHRLERWTSIVHFGVATGGAVRNYCLKSAR